MDEDTVKQTSAPSNLQMNPPCFIYRLPTDIIEIIFIHGARDYYSTYNGDPIPTAPSWINVSYVSRRWRNVALNCPTLWTYLFITSPRWTEELLARSKKAPLKLYMNVQSWNGEESLRFVKQVMDHVERIEELCLQLWSRHVDVLSNFPSSSAPRLQYLEIVVGLRPFEWPQVLFGGDTPALHTLELSRCPVPWYSFRLSGLRTLVLKDIPVQFQQNIVEFLATLSCMQDLTHLYLHGVLTSAASFLSSAVFYTFRKINLPRLSRLLISAPLSSVIAFLACVDIPLKAGLKLYCDVEDGFSSLDDYALLCPLLAQRFTMSNDQALFNPTIRLLDIASLEWDVAVTFRTSECKHGSVNHVFDIHCGCNIPLQVVLSYNDPRRKGHMEYIMSHICCSLPLLNVQGVQACSPPLSLTFWMDVLGCLQGLRYLKLRQGCMPPLASILSLSPRGFMNVHGRRNRAFAPALEELELEEIVFQPALERDVDQREATDLQSLYDALSTRKDAPIRLTMTRCNGHGSNHKGEKKRFSVLGCCVVV